MVVVDLALALICFAGECHPALVGDHTPRGTYLLEHQATEEPGYGGDLLVFQEDRTRLWAVHRVYTQVAAQRRVERLQSTRVELRRGVTSGCINVMPDVYSRLLQCCKGAVLMIK